MIKDIFYNPSKGEISVEILMGGIVVIAYTLQLWSSTSDEAKEIQKEIGTNKQTHDDKFVLDGGKPVTANEGRLVQLGSTIYTSETSTPYSITMKFTQDDAGQEVDLDEVTKEGVISQSDDGKFPAMGAILKPQP